MRISLILYCIALVLGCNGNNGESQGGDDENGAGEETGATGYDLTVDEHVLDGDALQVKVTLQDGDVAVKNAKISGTLICKNDTGTKTLSAPDATTDDQGAAALAFTEVVGDGVCDLDVSYTTEEGNAVEESIKVLVVTSRAPPPPIALAVEREGIPFCATQGNSSLVVEATGDGLGEQVGIDMELLYDEPVHTPSPTDANWQKVGAKKDGNKVEIKLNADGTVTPATAVWVRVNLPNGKNGSYVRACTAIAIDVGGGAKERICSEPVLVQMRASSAPDDCE